MMGLVMFLVIVVDVDARPAQRPWRSPGLGGESLLSSDKVPWFSRELAVPEGEGAMFRYGTIFWPGSQFGECFVEFRTPNGETVARYVGHGAYRAGHAGTKWKDIGYVFGCWKGSPNYFGERAWLIRYKK